MGEFAHLHQKYNQPLGTVITAIQAQRRSDIAAYRHLCNSMREYRFADLRHQILNYLASKQHCHIMGAVLRHYLEQFYCQMEISVKLRPSPDFNDYGGGAPDFRLQIKEFYRDCDGSEEWQLQQEVSLQQNDVKLQVVLGKMKCRFDFKTTRKLVIDVIELDLLANDNYGSFELIADPFLNNKALNRKHSCCKAGKQPQVDGVIVLVIEPEIVQFERLPEFQEAP